MMEFAK